MLKESPGIINFISSEFFKATCFVFTCRLLKRLYIIQVFCLFRITYPSEITGGIRMKLYLICLGMTSVRFKVYMLQESWVQQKKKKEFHHWQLLLPQGREHSFQ